MNKYITVVLIAITGFATITFAPVQIFDNALTVIGLVIALLFTGAQFIKPKQNKTEVEEEDKLQVYPQFVTQIEPDGRTAKALVQYITLPEKTEEEAEDKVTASQKILLFSTILFLFIALFTVIH